MKRTLLIVMLGIVVLGLLAAAGTASASTTTNTIHWSLLGGLFPGSTQVVDGTTYITGSVLYSTIYHATGPDGSRLLGYGVVHLDRVIPPKGDNYHHGEIVILAEDPKSFWVPALGWGNIAGRELLWSGTWNGITRNKQNHRATIVLTGWPGSQNANRSAVIQLHNGQYAIANPAATNYVDTPWNGVALITGP